ncbi:MAG: lamin tail domain-containing protein [bacterium]
MPAIFVIIIMLLSSLPALADNLPPVVITEIAPVPAADKEWLELYNRSGQPIDITGWKFFEDSTNHSLKEYRNGLIIAPGSFVVIANNPDSFLTDHPDFPSFIPLIDSSWGSLSTNGESIAIKDSQGNIVESFTYIQTAKYSLERKDTNLLDYTSANWQEHLSKDTAGLPNSNWTIPDETGDGQDGGGNNDQGGTGNTGDTNTGQESGNGNNNNDQTGNEETNVTNTQTSSSSSANLAITEALPDPPGDDRTGEFVEILNSGSQSINLLGWKLTIGSSSFNLPNDIIQPNDQIAFFRPQTKLSLANTGGAVNLVAPDGTASTVSYPTAISGKSYSLVGTEWLWAQPTPGTENIITELNLEEEIPTAKNSPLYTATALKEELKNTDDDINEETYISEELDPMDDLSVVEDQLSITDLKKTLTDKTVTITGTILLPPGQLGPLVMTAGWPATRITLARLNWPSFATGQLVKITGELSDNRIKVKKLEDVILLNKQEKIIPLPLATADVDEDGYLVSVKGTIVSASKTAWVIDDGSGEVKILLKKVSTKAKEGDTVSVTGVTITDRGILGIIPRDSNDIQTVKGEQETLRQSIQDYQPPDKAKQTWWAAGLTVVVSALGAAKVWIGKN